MQTGFVFFFIRHAEEYLKTFLWSKNNMAIVCIGVSQEIVILLLNLAKILEVDLE